MDAEFPDGYLLVLQQQLLAAQYDTAQGVPHPPRPQPGVGGHMQHPREHHVANIDPAISGAAPPSGMIPAPVDVNVNVAGPDHTQNQMGPPSPQDDSKYGKRELSTSKRAAQNRAAQVRLTLFL